MPLLKVFGIAKAISQKLFWAEHPNHFVRKYLLFCAWTIDLGCLVLNWMSTGKMFWPEHLQNSVILHIEKKTKKEQKLNSRSLFLEKHWLKNEIIYFLYADIDECARSLVDCGNNGTCKNTVGSYYCDCDVGYYYDIELSDICKGLHCLQIH